MTEADGSQPTVPGSTSAPSPSAEPSSPLPERETVIDAVADLLQMVVNWIRQEAAGVMRDKVVLPLQQVGLTVASAMAAATLFVIGMIFMFVALLLVLAAWLGWPGALALVGSVILIGAGVFTYLKMRSIQT